MSGKAERAVRVRQRAALVLPVLALASTVCSLMVGVSVGLVAFASSVSGVVDGWSLAAAAFTLLGSWHIAGMAAWHGGIWRLLGRAAQAAAMAMTVTFAFAAALFIAWAAVHGLPWWAGLAPVLAGLCMLSVPAAASWSGQEASGAARSRPKRVQSSRSAPSGRERRRQR